MAVHELEISAKRRVIRTPTNPMDRTTIVSIFPKAISERKYTIQPGIFEIPAGTYDKPELLVVGPSSWWREIEENQPLLEIPQSSIVVAESVIKDYCNGMLGYNGEDSGPGLFYILGEVNLAEVKKNYRTELDKAAIKQKNYFLLLVRLADSLWSRSNGNPLAISDDMRLAARQLGYEKDWLKDHQAIEMERCKACGSLRNPLYPICPTCKNIDMNHPMAKDMKFAQ